MYVCVLSSKDCIEYNSKCGNCKWEKQRFMMREPLIYQCTLLEIIELLASLKYI